MKHHVGLLFALAHISFGLNVNNECQAPGIKRGSSPRKFVVCVEKDGQLRAIENECSEGLTFDYLRKTCSRVFPKPAILLAAIDLPSNVTNYTEGTTEIVKTVSPPTSSPCKGPGAYCSNCNTLSFCVSGPLSNGAKFLKTILNLPCEPGSVCVTTQGCVKTLNGGLCREGPFICGDVGLYPDIYNCTKFHSCAVGPQGQLIDTPITCSGGLLGNRWNPETSTCGWSENDSSCRAYPVPLCTKPLEMRAVGGQIYSICVEDRFDATLSPILFRCPQDSVFDANSYACVNPT